MVAEGNYIQLFTKSFILFKTYLQRIKHRIVLYRMDIFERTAPKSFRQKRAACPTGSVSTTGRTRLVFPTLTRLKMRSQSVRLWIRSNRINGSYTRVKVFNILASISSKPLGADEDAAGEDPSLSFPSPPSTPSFCSPRHEKKRLAFSSSHSGDQRVGNRLRLL